MKFITALAFTLCMSVGNAMGNPYTTGEEFYVTPDTGSDQTEYLQNALDSFGHKGGILWLKQGKYRFTQLKWRRGVKLFGVGAGSPPHYGTLLEQIAGTNKSAIITDDRLVKTDYMHWSEIRGVQIRKETGATDTVGSGIEFFHKFGELTRLSDIIVIGFPEDGIRVGEGGTPGYIDHVNVTKNGRYGINLYRHDGSTARYHGFVLEYISGDANGEALINIENVGLAGEQLVLRHLKAETTTAGKQQIIVRLREIYNLGVSITGVTALALAGGVGVDVVNVSGYFTGTLRMSDIGIEGYTNALARPTHGVYIPASVVAEGATMVFADNQWRTY